MTYTPKIPDPSNSIEKLGKNHKLKEMKKAFKKRDPMNNLRKPENEKALPKVVPKPIKGKIRFV